MFDNRLRPIYEFLPATVAMLGALALLRYPDTFFAIMPTLALMVAGFLTCWSLY
jgi:hypothetical protein